MNWTKNMLFRKWALWAAWLCGFMTVSFAGMTVFGYWAGYDAYRKWTVDGAAMALNTAVCLLMVGGAVMLLARIGMGEDCLIRRVLKLPMCSVGSH